MKAKMLDKVAEAGEYLCQKCETRFFFTIGHLRCPECGNSFRLDLIPIYMENDEQEEQLHLDDDYGQGD